MTGPSARRPSSAGGRPAVLVTGASAGIGRATSDLLAARGWAVYGASRRGSGSPGWTPVEMDVDSDQSVASGVASVLAASEGRLDAVVAGAGWGLAGPVEATPLAEAREQFETNFWGVVRVVQAALPHLRAASSGRIAIVSSIGGVIGLPFQAFYSATKFAVEGLGEALAYEVAPFGVRVALVEPGNVRTDFTARRRTVALPPEDPYRTAAERSLAKMAADEAAGADAASVAAAVARVLESSRPPRRVSVGHPAERVGILAKRLLPFRLFERGARGSLGV